MSAAAGNTDYGFSVAESYRQCCFREAKSLGSDPLSLASRFDVFVGPNYKTHEYWQSLIRQAKLGVAAATAREAVLSTIDAMNSRPPVMQPDFVRRLMGTFQSTLSGAVIAKLEGLALDRAYPKPCGLIAFAVGVKEAAKPYIIKIESGVVTPLPNPGNIRIDPDTDWLSLV